jgi:tetratricopeptide (TPR) repeat protein
MITSIRRMLFTISWLGSLALAARAENSEAERYLGEALGNTWNGKYDEAIANFGRAIALDPKYVLAYANRSCAYEMQGKFNLALADINEAVELAPRYSGAYLVRGGIYLDLKDPQKALPDFDRAIGLRPMPVMYYRRGETHFALGQYDLAIKDFSQALSPTDLPTPQNPDILDQSTVAIDLQKELPYYYRGLSYQRLGRSAEALADLSKAAETDPQLAPKLPKTTINAGSPPSLENAINAYTHALGEEPSDEGAYFDHNRAGLSEGDYLPALPT